MKLKLTLPIALVFLAFYSCQKHDVPGLGGKYSADVANDWMQMQIRLTRSTTGYNSVVSDRSFGYAGITLYEAVAPGVQGYQRLLPQIGGQAIAPDKSPDQYYWPASV